ncbi:MAG: hypothetical protein VYC97_05060, partial [SAR324 cluster bacterium]|nr:hypothetical protein [SAR324 cluster bacterium]
MLGPFCRSGNPVGRVRGFMRRIPTGQKHLKNKLPDYALFTFNRPTSLKNEIVEGVQSFAIFWISLNPAGYFPGLV